MFVAWRDLRFARGRFVLIGTVVALITVLVGFLSGLTAGLAGQNVSAILALPAQQIVFSEPAPGASGEGGGPSYADSAVTAEQQRVWDAAEGVSAVSAMGISQGRAEHGDTRAGLAFFGVESGQEHAPARAGQVVLSAGAASVLGAEAGDAVTLGGRDYTVDAVAGDAWYSHTAVAWLGIEDWRAGAAATGNPGAYASVLVVTGDADWASVEAAAHTVSASPVASLTAIGSFRSEIGSLLLMVAMLFGISALVIGAFFTVWGMQRRGDVAVLKALGASTASLVRDALGQALVVLVVGVGLGIGVVAVLGTLAGSALPFVLSPLTTALPGAAMILLGLAGAAVALRSVTTADPLTALGSNR